MQEGVLLVEVVGRLGVGQVGLFGSGISISFHLQ